MRIYVPTQVRVGDKKYACETCIKGHRSSTCKHTDRPLFEIKKKGRPVTQCEHCRELRKTKQVHVKCMCGAKEQQQLGQNEDPTSAPSSSTATIGIFSKKGGKKMPVSATFPSGLPETLGASVAVSDGSDSEPGSEVPCMCDSIGVCTCATPRTQSIRGKSSKPKSRKNSRVEHDFDKELEPQMNQPAALVASAHGAGKRPVLPRPSPTTGPSSDRASPPRSSRSPGASQPSRAHPSSFSPYERAYEYARGAEVGSELSPSLYASIPPQNLPPPALPIPSSDAQYPVGQDSEDLQTFMTAWLASMQPQGSEGSMDPPITCNCGPNCACPGCIIHQNVPNPPANTPTCVNPQTCSACMDCTALALTQENPGIEEWFRRLANSGSFSPLQSPRMQQSALAMPSPMPMSLPQQLQGFDPSLWPTYALWPNLQNQSSSASPPEDAISNCCSGQCQCSTGSCTCPSDCCGCCAGCTCSNCAHEDRGLGSGKTLTFAVSGERGACCSAGRRRSVSDSHLPMDVVYGQQSQPGPSGLNMPEPVGRSMPDLASQFGFQGQQLDLRGSYEEWTAAAASPSNSTTMDSVPNVSLSRASSTSSRSSRGSHHSQSSHGSPPHHDSVSPSPNAPTGPLVSSCTTLETTDIGSSRPATTPSTAASTASSPIPPPFTPSVDPDMDHRTFDGTMF
ncbi:hypothetical protein BDY19DRAFT_111371 [Irpex rosettiformis]|uniref:Uncharacterized protein n=1 Tax=Irpex rosettiformis TaxID=378272 RepID=A0ACB8U5L9_9APHY|nr:hypothetical protein BDY19DRAFT_111371 [Irpex rosettiformis]